MTTLNSLNVLQKELRDTLNLNDDYRLEVRGDEVRANFIGLHLSSVFQPIVDLERNAPHRWAMKPCCAPSIRRAISSHRPPRSGRQKWPNGW